MVSNFPSLKPHIVIGLCSVCNRQLCQVLSEIAGTSTTTPLIDFVHSYCTDLKLCHRLRNYTALLCRDVCV